MFLTLPEYRKLARDHAWHLCNGATGRSEADPVYLNELTEGRDQGAYRDTYSSCADMIHAVWFALGVRAPWINRKEHKGWRQALNVSLLAHTAANWLYGSGNDLRKEAPPVSAPIDCGDALIIWHEITGKDAHVMMALEHDVSTKRSLVAEAGQPGSAVHNKQFIVSQQPARGGRMTPCLKLGIRELQRWLPLGDVLAKADSLGQLVEPRPLVVTAPTVLPPPASPPLPLRVGSKGEAVREWQRYLVGQGFKVTVDGDYGPKTQSATMVWQSSHGLVADGVVGAKTRAAAGL